MMKIDCPVCDGPTRSVFRKNDTDVLDCAKCRHRCAGLATDEQHTARHYDDDYFTAGGDGYVNYIGDGPIVQRRGRWYAGLLAKHNVSVGRVLDVGAAAGFFLRGMMDAGWEGVGLEPNAGMARYGVENLGADIRRGTLESLDLGQPFDLVSFIQVAAHLTNPLAAFRNAARHTRPGGHWMIETWNHCSLATRAFGRSWHEYSPPRTLHWFSPRSIAALGERCGMKLIASGHPDKSISGEHAKSLLQHTIRNSRLARILLSPARLIPDQLRIPYPADDLKWYLLQKQV